MKYEKIVSGRFIERPNRFIAMVEIDGQAHKCHVKNTGRCRELLVSGATVYLEPSDNPARATAYSLIAVEKNGMIINMDSQVPNKVVMEYINAGRLFENVVNCRGEVVYGKSRLDVYAEYEAEGQVRQALIEVKGVTLEDNGVVRFPDAPTVRGTRHIYELIDAAKAGYEAYIFFVIQLQSAKYFSPNWATDPEFAQALKEAAQNNVKIIACDCVVTPDSIVIDREVEVRL